MMYVIWSIICACGAFAVGYLLYEGWRKFGTNKMFAFGIFCNTVYFAYVICGWVK